MDINNYSYTGSNFFDDGGDVFAAFMNCDGYGDITLEWWGSDPARRVFVVTVCIPGAVDLCEAINADASAGWETLRPAYAAAARLYNEYAPEREAAPLF